MVRKFSIVVILSTFLLTAFSRCDIVQASGFPPPAPRQNAGDKGARVAEEACPAERAASFFLLLSRHWVRHLRKEVEGKFRAVTRCQSRKGWV